MHFLVILCPRRRARLLVVIILALCLAGCTSARSFRAAGGTAVRDQPRVLLMPPDVLLLEVTTAGLPLPRADWSARAEDTLVDVTAAAVAARRGQLIHYRRPEGEKQPYFPAHLPALHLHQAVLESIITFRYGGSQRGQGRPPQLVTKGKDGLEWTLGEAVAPLRADYDADYALFLTYRQASSNAGRAMVSAAAFALFGVIGPTSQAIGLASLVDLHTGSVVWTNLLTGQAVEVGEPEGLREKAQKLLQDWPL